MTVSFHAETILEMDRKFVNDKVCFVGEIVMKITFFLELEICMLEDDYDYEAEVMVEVFWELQKKLQSFDLH